MTAPPGHPGDADGPPTRRATRQSAGRLPCRWAGGRDQGLRPAGPRPRRHDGRSGGRGRGLHAERVRGRARPPVAGQPGGHVRRSAGRVRLGRGRRLDERFAPTPRRARPATPTRRRSGVWSPRRSGSTRPTSSTCRPASSARGCRSTRSRPGSTALVPATDGRRRRPRGGGDGAADDRFGHEGRHDDRGPARTGRRSSVAGHRHRHRQGRRDDPPEHGHDAVGRS